MDPNAFTFILLFSLHASGAPGACCAAQGRIALPPSIACKADASGSCQISALDICRAIGEANKDAAFSVECVAPLK